MDDLKRRTVIAGAGAVAALAVIAPSPLQAQSKIKSDVVEPDLTGGNANSNSEPGQYWVWFGGHWDFVQ